MVSRRIRRTRRPIIRGIRKFLLVSHRTLANGCVSASANKNIADSSNTDGTLTARPPHKRARLSVTPFREPPTSSAKAVGNTDKPVVAHRHGTQFSSYDKTSDNDGLSSASSAREPKKMDLEYADDCLIFSPYFLFVSRRRLLNLPDEGPSLAAEYHDREEAPSKISSLHEAQREGNPTLMQLGVRIPINLCTYVEKGKDKAEHVEEKGLSGFRRLSPPEGPYLPPVIPHYGPGSHSNVGRTNVWADT